MAYFDNAATTYPKPEVVYTSMDKFYRLNGANAGRGRYNLAQSANALIGETRVLVQELLHCPAKQVVFTPTATIALNIIIQGLICKGAKTIYISPFEHNAVSRTLHHFEEAGTISVHQLTVSQDFKYDLDRMRYQFESECPDLVIMSHASNVLGLIAPVTEICSLAKKFGAIFSLQIWKMWRHCLPMQSTNNVLLLRLFGCHEGNLRVAKIEEHFCTVFACWKRGKEAERYNQKCP